MESWNGWVGRIIKNHPSPTHKAAHVPKLGVHFGEKLPWAIPNTCPLACVTKLNVKPPQGLPTCQDLLEMDRNPPGIVLHCCVKSSYQPAGCSSTNCWGLGFFLLFLSLMEFCPMCFVCVVILYNRIFIHGIHTQPLKHVSPQTSSVQQSQRDYQGDKNFLLDLSNPPFFLGTVLLLDKSQ